MRRGIGSDPRIGYHFLYAGCGYGGSCFPKDVQALIRTARESGHDLRILEAVEEVNDAQKEVLVQQDHGKPRRRPERPHVRRVGPRVQAEYRRHARGAEPSRDRANCWRAAPTVRAYDPVAMAEARRVFALDLARRARRSSRVCTFDEHAERDALPGADALVIVTEWKEFKSPDFAHLKSGLKTPVIFDGRNLYEPEAMTELGIDYHSIGRPYAQPSELPADV